MLQNPNLNLDDVDIDDDVFEIETPILNEACDVFDAWEYIPFAHHIIRLHNIKEAVGKIPFELTWEEIRGLVIYGEESSKKMAYENWKMKQQTKQYNK